MTGVQTCALPICFPVTIQLDDYLKPEAARLKFSRVKNLKQIDVKGAKHLWVGEPMVHLVLSEIVKIIAPSRLPLAQEI